MEGRTTVNFQEPLLLLLISPVLLAGFYMLRRKVNKTLVISRVLTVSLLIIALANPFVITSNTIRDDTPQVTVIADKTISNDLFDTSQGESLQEYLKTRTPTKYREIKGIRTALGDEILKNSAAGEHIVLVSDLNNNHGADLSDAIALSRSEGSHVYAVEQTPIHTDTGVEIVGSKNIIVGNENTYQLILRHVGEETTYTLTVEADSAPLLEETITQGEGEKIIPLPYTPPGEGAHRLTATITPSGEDRFALNNIFYKSVFAAPKPKILFIGKTTSPLKTVLTELYDVQETTTLDRVNLADYKTLVINNKNAKTLNPYSQKLRDYTANGGSLLIVGGENSFDRGEYNNSNLEKILPVLSKPAQYKGGRNIVIVIDASGSTYGDVIGMIDRAAIDVLNDDDINADTYLGVVAFGSSAEQIGIKKMTQGNVKEFESIIRTIGPGSTESQDTNMNKGLEASEEMLRDFTGLKEIIVISDGKISSNYDKLLETATKLAEDGINMYFVQVATTGLDLKELENPDRKNMYSIVEKIKDKTTAQYIPLKDTDGLDIAFEPLPDAPEEEEEQILRQFGLTITGGEHFITQYQNISGDLTGFNDVTPKLGAQRLIATAIGKPVLTVWNFGLGRTAALTTDDGNKWAGVLYTPPNSKLISSTMNWLIGDPRPAGDTITAPDTWLGTPGQITIKTSTLPTASLEGDTLSFTREGDHYTTTIEPKTAGYHNLGGYEIATNYPLEYREIGFNDKMRNVIEAHNGTVHSYEDAKSLLLADIKDNSVRVVNEPASAKMPFIIAAIIIFLAEIILRRLRGIKTTNRT